MLVIGNRFNCDDATIWLTTGEFFVKYFRFSVNRVTMKSRPQVPHILKLKVGNRFTADIRHTHTQRDTEDKRANYETLLELCILTVIRIDMQRIVIHGEHAEKCIIIFSNGTTGPVFIDISNFKLFKSSTKLHLVTPFPFISIR